MVEIISPLGWVASWTGNGNGDNFDIIIEEGEDLGDRWTFDENEEFDTSPDALDRYVENLATELELAAQGEQ